MAKGDVRKKKILIACGTGIATSVAVSYKIQSILEKAGYDISQIEFKTCSVPELQAKAPGNDLIITTSKNNKELPVKVILGVQFLIGKGYEPILKEIIDYLGLIKKA